MPEFLKERASGKDSRFYSAYAAAFVDLKEPAAAVALLGMKKRRRPTANG